MAEPVRHRQTKGAATDMFGLQPLRHTPTLPSPRTERLWRSVKYEEVYLKAHASVAEARDGIGKYLTFYNTRRPHQALDGNTPDKAYFTQLQLPAAA